MDIFSIGFTPVIRDLTECFGKILASQLRRTSISLAQATISLVQANNFPLVKFPPLRKRAPQVAAAIAGL